MVAPNKTAREIREGKRLPELLCPAGSYDALCAAIEGGADAVYMGGVAFNARINAKNFTEEELKRGIELAHSYGTKIYIAANTLVYDRELDGFLHAAEHAIKCGADALIVADLGGARAIRSRLDAELHASTQLSGHGTETANILREAGFSRMVCAREMSREDIQSFIDHSPLESEVFVHGALCVCHSGQCLFSSLVGGRSGNRGECAQPCRLPFKVGGRDAYPLSLKDLTLSEHIPELCRMGVASLKIEGRMKSPEYVYNVTRIWRRLLDSRRSATAEDVRELEAVFSRGGFTDGYFTRRIDRKMLGIRSAQQKQVTRELEPFEGIKRKIDVDMQVRILANSPAELTVKRIEGGESVTVTGAVPEAARTAPIDEAAVRKSLSKLGDTPYALANMSVELDEGLILPISQLNALRREAVGALTQKCVGVREVNVREAEKKKPSGRRTKSRTAVFYNTAAIPESAYDFFDIIYTPLEVYDGSTEGVLLPPVIFDSERAEVKKMLSDAVARGAKHGLVSNLGHIDLVKDAGLTLHGDFRLNVYNNGSAEYLERLGFEDVILSPELTQAQMRDIGGRTSVCVYGRTPLMITEKCVGKEIADCNACSSGKAVLTDRRGVSFPVLRVFAHRSMIVNSAPFYMADKQKQLDANGIAMTHFIFTVESKREAEQVITAYQKALPPKDPAKIKRIK